MLTAAQRQARDGKLTASRIGILMDGETLAIYNLWREMIGDPDWQEPALSNTWEVQLGASTEKLNLDWYERKTGQLVARRGEVVQHPTLPWAAATLDGWDASLPGPVEAKHVNGFTPLSNVIPRYMPQIHWQMIVTESDLACLSFIIGANKPVRERVMFNKAYADELMARAKVFWDCVETLTPPVAMPPIAAPVQFDAMREVDMTGNNLWANSTSLWLETHKASKAFDIAVKDIKAMVEADVRLAFGYGVRVKRARNGALAIREIAW